MTAVIHKMSIASIFDVPGSVAWRIRTSPMVFSSRVHPASSGVQSDTNRLIPASYP